MGVYNPNAIMPNNCAVCNEECKYRNITAHKRHKRCPLIEVKTPHGDLVDREEIEVVHYTDADGEHIETNAPTVIKAEESE